MTRWTIGMVCVALFGLWLHRHCRQKARFNAPTLVDDWRGFLNGEPRITPAAVPAVKPLKAVVVPPQRTCRKRKVGVVALMRRAK